jgi:tight adherence protein C
MQQTLSPTEEEVDDLLTEQKKVEMEKSFVSRTMGPITKKFGAMFRSSARGAAGAQIRDMLEQAGHPLGMHYPEFLGLKLFCLLSFMGLGVVTSFFAAPFLLTQGAVPIDASTLVMTQALWVVIFTYLGFTGPTFWLRKFVNKRVKQFVNRWPMSSIWSFWPSKQDLVSIKPLARPSRKTKGPLTEELSRVLDEIRVGKPQGEAFRDMSKRVRMSELTLLVAAIDQATRMGTGLAHALRLQATEIPRATHGLHPRTSGQTAGQNDDAARVLHLPRVVCGDSRPGGNQDDGNVGNRTIARVSLRMCIA